MESSVSTAIDENELQKNYDINYYYNTIRYKILKSLLT